MYLNTMQEVFDFVAVNRDQLNKNNIMYIFDRLNKAMRSVNRKEVLNISENENLKFIIE